MSTFYRYYILITVIPLTTIALAVVNITGESYREEFKYFFQVIFGASIFLISMLGISVLSYIEGLRLDAILYARVVNSIREHFFNLKEAKNYSFGKPVLPTSRDVPKYQDFGAHFIIYMVCAVLNSVYGAAGVFIMYFDINRIEFLKRISVIEWLAFIGIFSIMMATQIYIRHHLTLNKTKQDL